MLSTRQQRLRKQVNDKVQDNDQITASSPAENVEHGCDVVPVTDDDDWLNYQLSHVQLQPQPTHVLAIAHSLLLDVEYGTVCQPSCESQTLHSDNFDEHSKRIYLVIDSCSAE